MRKHKLILPIMTIWLILTAIGSDAAAHTIAGAEYFIDNDPGAGKATLLDPNDGAFNSKTETAEKIIDTSTLSVGPHLLGIRFRKSNGVWSYTRTSWFYVTGERILTAAEWFINTDPGKGNGNPIALPDDGVWDEPEEDVSVNNINISSLTENDPNGHIVFIRFRDSDGNWGITRQANFEVRPDLYIAAAEWTTNPLSQAGTGNPMQAADGRFDEPEEEVIASNINPDQLGSHTTIYVRVKDNLGRWSTRGGLYLDANGNWQFDPERGWTAGSTVQLN